MSGIPVLKNYHENDGADVARIFVSSLYGGFFHFLGLSAYETKKIHRG